MISQCVAIKRPLEDDPVYDSYDFLLPKINYSVVVIPKKRTPDNTKRSEGDTEHYHPKHTTRDMTPMSSLPVIQPARYKMIKQLKNVGYKSSPMIDSMLWKESPKSLIVYEKPNAVVERMVNRTNNNSPTKTVVPMECE